MGFNQFKIAVVYVSSGQEKTYIGTFVGDTAQQSCDAAKEFVRRYFRPSQILSVNEVPKLL